MLPGNNDTLRLKNNDILRRLRYVFDYDDSTMIAIFGMVDCVVTRQEVSAWLKRDTDPGLEPCSDVHLSAFLNGLIIEQRGKREGQKPPNDPFLNNNIILRKLKIALNLEADDMIEILALAGLTLSKHELSAFFRKPGNVHFRACKDQALRNFLNGLRLKYRGPGENAA